MTLPADSRSHGTEQQPLGSQPDEEDVLDLANEYSFPASDPIAISTPEQKAHEKALCRESGEACPVADKSPP